MDKWMTAAEIAALKLPGLPATTRGVSERANRDAWSKRQRQASGGGWQYDVSALPKPIQRALAKHLLAIGSAPQVPAPLPLALPEAGDLKTQQRSRMEARAALLAHIDHLVIERGISRGAAIRVMVEMAESKELPPELQRLVPVANGKSNAARSLTRATIYNWLKARETAGGNVLALATKSYPDAPVPGWADTFMQLWARPTNPGMAECLAAWPSGVERPSYDQVRRFMRRLDAISKNQGRMGPKALKQLKAYIKRDTSELWPGAVFIGDGHTCKWEVAHPIHGNPFRPEVTAILDVFTRRWVGWSVALAENTWSVADALRYSVCYATQPAIFYYDNGAGAKNTMWDDALVGLAARLSISKFHSAPWSSQARGIIEVFNKNVLHPLARQQPSYLGNRMDDEARQRAFKISRKEIKATGTSRLIPGWPDFMACIAAEQEAYNNRPHSELPKIIDPETGKRRSMSPNEMWQLAIAEGWQPDPLSKEEARDLFRPAERRKVSRCIVNLFGNQYFHPALEALHGEEVTVSYDIHDAHVVWVRDLAGRLICEAQWDGHKNSYFPVSKVQDAERLRVEGKLRRLEGHAQIARAELRQGVIEGHAADFLTLPAPVDVPMAQVNQPEAVGLTPEQLAEAERILEQMTTPAAPVTPTESGERPNFATDLEWALWLLDHRDQVMDADRELLRDCLRNTSFRQLLEWEGVSANTLSELAKNSNKAA